MNLIRKKVLLIIAIVFPIALVLIFEFDSKSVYEVPTLYEAGVKNIPIECSYQYPSPYSIPDSVVRKLFAKNPELAILSFDTTSREVRQNLNRVREQFKDDNVLIKEEPQDYAYYSIMRNCVFLIQGDSSLVLVDSTGRIRGYYNGAKREDVDRLLDEGRIILNKY